MASVSLMLAEREPAFFKPFVVLRIELVNELSVEDVLYDDEALLPELSNLCLGEFPYVSLSTLQQTSAFEPD